MKYFFVRQSLIFFLILINSIFVIGQGIKGRITDPAGEAISFANIYVPDLKKGTTSNIDGYFELKLPEGELKVQFTYLGYATQSHLLNISSDFKIVNIVLYPQNLHIKEVKILASGEDPAYYVMRRAIALAPYYMNQVSEYTSKVYLKGSGIINKVPRIMKKKLKKEGIEEKKPFVMESLSEIHFELPDKLDQKVISIRSSGDDNNTYPMEMITNNLYQASQYGVISPFDKNAFQTYRFKLEGVFEDQGRTINKIEVIPKRKGKDVFWGYIYIAEDFWNIHSADLHLRLPMTDASMHQVYAPVDENAWMPVSLDFDIKFKGFGFDVSYTYVASVNDYKIKMNPKLDHSMLINMQAIQDEERILYEQIEIDSTQKKKTNREVKQKKKMEDLYAKDELSNREMQKLQKLVQKEAQRSLPPEPLEILERVKFEEKNIVNDSAYWEEMRPIPLSTEEKESFTEKDSLVGKMNPVEYRDSIRNAQRKFKFKHLLFGKTYLYKEDSAKYSSRFRIPGLLDLSSWSYNTVDGLRYDMRFSYNRSDTSGHRFSADLLLGYAFSRVNLDAGLALSYTFNPFNRSMISLGGGHSTKDYGSGMPVFINTIYTLFIEENHKKYYQKDYISLLHSRELLNGFWFKGGIEYMKRYPLQNHTTFTFIDWKDKAFTPNTPEHPDMDTSLVEAHTATIFSVNLKYTPRQRYYMRKTGKFPAGSKYPTFKLNYSKGLSGLGSADFDFIEIGVNHSISTGLNDRLWYAVNGGGFITNQRLYFADYKQFKSNPVLLMSTKNKRNTYRLLPYYNYATNKGFIEGFVFWENDRFLLKRLPLVNRTLITEGLMFNYLSTSDLKNYFELGYGVYNIFLFLNVEAVVGFENGKYWMTGFKISANIF